MAVYVDVCQNEFEAEIIRGHIEKSPLKLVDSAERASQIVLVIADTFPKIDIDAKKSYVVIGCMNKKLIADINKKIESPSILSLTQIAHIVTVLEELEQGNSIQMPGKEEINPYDLIQRRSKGVARIPLISGCSERCESCYADVQSGSFTSYPKSDIINEAKKAIESGCKEIVFVGQESSAYGTERIWRSSLAELAAEIVELDSEIRLNLGRLSPKNILPIEKELRELYEKDQVYKMLWLPLISGSEEIVKKEGCEYSLEGIKSFVNALRRNSPLHFKTEIVVGAHEETVDEFNTTVELIKELSADETIVHLASQSAATKDRKRIVEDIQRNITRLNNEKWIDWEGEVVCIEPAEHDYWRSQNIYAKNVLIQGTFKPMEKKKVRITSFKEEFLIGEIS